MSSPNQPNPPFPDLVLPHFQPLTDPGEEHPGKQGWWDRLGRRGQSGVVTFAVVLMAGGVYWSSQGEAAPPPIKPTVVENVIVQQPSQIDFKKAETVKEIYLRAKVDVPLNTRILKSNAAEYFEIYEGLPDQWKDKVVNVEDLNLLYVVKPIPMNLTLTNDLFGIDQVDLGSRPNSTYDRRYETPEKRTIFRYEILPTGEHRLLGEVDPTTNKLVEKRPVL